MKGTSWSATTNPMWSATRPIAIPAYAEMRGLMNTGIEIRRDLIADQAGEKSWADQLARILVVIEATLRPEKLI